MKLLGGYTLVQGTADFGVIWVHIPTRMQELFHGCLLTPTTNVRLVHCAFAEVLTF